MHAMISFERATKLYGTVIGVNEISLALGPGAYGLLGPNGSGKSTLLNLLIGQLRPTIGMVKVYGESPRNNPELCRRIGFCPGSEGLYANVTGFEWVRYLLELHGLTVAEATVAANEALERVGMTYAQQRPIAYYSRGMRQRVKLAQAIAHDPELLILDEPFNGLDPIARHDMAQLLRQWIDEGKSLILASHLLHEVESITQSFLLIYGGRLLASGTADEVEAILADAPNVITLHTDQPHRLAGILVQEQATESITIAGASITVETRRPQALIANLPDWLAESDISVTQMTSGDDSLQALFNSLMRVQRGEI